MTKDAAGFKELSAIVAEITTKHGVNEGTQNTSIALHYVYSLGYRDGLVQALSNKPSIPKRIIKGAGALAIGYLVTKGALALFDAYQENKSKK